jgi:hypothetical protein
VPFHQDVVEVARLLGRELAEAEVIDDDEIGGPPAPELALEGVVGARLVQGLQQAGGLDELAASAGPAGAVAEGAGEVRLPHADRAAEHDVLVGVEPGQAEQFADARAGEAHRGVPHHLLQRDRLLEAGRGEALGERVGLAPVDLVLEDELQELERAEAGLPSPGGAVRERRE